MDDCREAFNKWVSTGLISKELMPALYMAWQAAWEHRNKHTLPFVGVTQEELDAGDKIRDEIHASQNLDDTPEARRIKRKLEKSAKT